MILEKEKKWFLEVRSRCRQLAMTMYYQDINACCKTYQGGGSAALPPLLSGSEVWGFDGSKKMYEIRAL